MKTLFSILVLILLTLRCGASKTSTPKPTKTSSSASSSVSSNSDVLVTDNSLSGPNVLTVKIGKMSVCGTIYVNEPCASISLCVPGTSTCQTITDMVVDTGSVGVRVFKSVLNIDLPSVEDSSSKPIAECAEFGSAETWGPVATAEISLAGEPLVKSSIQLIDGAYEKPPSNCSSSVTSPSEAGFNGILGIGLFTSDCGSACEVQATNNMYFSCANGSCSGIAIPESQQLQNPVALFPTDNNGLLLACRQ